MRILVATSWGTACGIANYAEMAIEAMRQADPSLEFDPRPEALDPAWVYEHVPQILWLNWHRGLHSRWTPEILTTLKRDCPWLRILISWHDSRGEAPPDALEQALHDLADVFVVHEPCEGLPQQVLIRQGVPAQADPVGWVPREWGINPRPILGTCGFNFPWKEYDRLAEVTRECGWGYLVCSNNATEADKARWQATNPWTFVVRGFLTTSSLVGYLAACDATCFAYQCANSGTSGAIRLGLAARKPVIAWGSCRQFRDLYLLDKMRTLRLTGEVTGIEWCTGFEELPDVLARTPLQRVDPGIVALAERDSWVHQGQTYAKLFRGLA